jgi:hypothetical protein
MCWDVEAAIKEWKGWICDVDGSMLGQLLTVVGASLPLSRPAGGQTE